MVKGFTGASVLVFWLGLWNLCSFTATHVETGAYCGTAFYIAPNYVLTANHVVSDRDQAYLENKYPAQVVYHDSGNDVAVLYTSHTSSNPLLISNAYGNFNVTVYGYPVPDEMGFNLKTRSGTGSIAQHYISRHYINFVVDIWPGNSGSPILAGNYVIGLVTDGYTDSSVSFEGSHRGFGTAGDALLYILQKAGIVNEGDQNSDPKQSTVLICDKRLSL